MLDRYHPVEFFEHPVGVGSVGLLTIVAHFESRAGERLYLQVKEAVASALEPYLGKSVYGNHGERVIAGQHLMQAASDLFVGWTSAEGATFTCDSCVTERRRSISTVSTARQLIDFAQRCGAVLARAHARTGDPQAIADILVRAMRSRMAWGALRACTPKQIGDYEEFCRG